MAKKAKKKATKKAAKRPAKKAAKKAASKAAKRPARKAKGKKGKPVELIISKSRTKNAAGINVSGEFYGALDEAVREMISGAERRAAANGRKTLRPQDL